MWYNQSSDALDHSASRSLCLSTNPPHDQSASSLPHDHCLHSASRPLCLTITLPLDHSASRSLCLSTTPPHDHSASRPFRFLPPSHRQIKTNSSQLLHEIMMDDDDYFGSNSSVAMLLTYCVSWHRLETHLSRSASTICVVVVQKS